MSLSQEQAIQDVATKIKDIAQPYRLEDSEIFARVKEAVKNYSKKRPMVKVETIEAETGESIYELPEDFIYLISAPSSSSYLDPGGEVRYSGLGLVPVASTAEEYNIQGSNLEIRPTPGSDRKIELRYAAFHMLSETDEDAAPIDPIFLTVPVADNELIILGASILCLETILVQMASSNFSYTSGDVKIDKTKQADSIKEAITIWQTKYDREIDKAAGSRS